MFVIKDESYLPEVSGLCSEALQEPFQDDGGRDFAVGRLGYDDGPGAFDDVVRDNHVAAHGQAVHEVGLVGDGHLAVADGPRAVCAEYLSVVVACVCRPALGVDEVCAFEGLHLVVFHAGVSDELGGQFVAVGMGDDEVVVGGVHPFGKRVGHGLGQRTGVRGPGHDDLRAGGFLVFFYRDEVGKALERVACGGFHGEDGSAGVLDELVEYDLVVVVVAVFKAGE